MDMRVPIPLSGGADPMAREVPQRVSAAWLASFSGGARRVTALQRGWLARAPVLLVAAFVWSVEGLGGQEVETSNPVGPITLAPMVGMAVVGPPSETYEAAGLEVGIWMSANTALTGRARGLWSGSGLQSVTEDVTVGYRLAGAPLASGALGVVGFSHWPGRDLVTLGVRAAGRAQMGSLSGGDTERSEGVGMEVELMVGAGRTTRATDPAWKGNLIVQVALTLPFTIRGQSR